MTYLSVAALAFTLGFWAAMATIKPRNFKIELPDLRRRKQWPKEIDTEKRD